MFEMVGKKILIVDDDFMSAKLMKMLIGNSDNIETASNGREGLRKINKQRFDLIISDVHMPVMTGIEMYVEAKKSDPGIKDRMLFLSASTDPEMIGFFKEQNLAYMVKPSPVTQIRDMLRKIIG
ncbi:MAG: response regulator [bacterium]|nr:response regulator [bacterium]